MQENPDGLLRKEKMFDMYHEVLSETKAKMFVKQIFSKECSTGLIKIYFINYLPPSPILD